ncbi:MAG: tetratricopeptide repeat protein [Kouleothrix sp.]
MPASPATLAALEQQVAADPAAAGPAFELAQRYRALQRLDDAAAILQVAAQANPNDVALQQLWGDTLRDAGRNDEAESAYRAAVAANPSAGNYNKLGAELLRAGKPDRAAEALLAAIEADPNAAEPYFHLGQVYEQQGRTDQAIEQYRSYLTIAKPTDSFYQEATAALGRLGR